MFVTSKASSVRDASSCPSGPDPANFLFQVLAGGLCDFPVGIFNKKSLAACGLLPDGLSILRNTSDLNVVL